jgi:hypothetical protein
MKYLHRQSAPPSEAISAQLVWAVETAMGLPVAYVCTEEAARVVAQAFEVADEDREWLDASKEERRAKLGGLLRARGVEV